MYSIYTLSTLAALISITDAALYPTHPIQSTVLSAERDHIIRWRDDSNEPHVYALARLSVELMDDSEVSWLDLGLRVTFLLTRPLHGLQELVSTLASNIKPTDYAAKINIPTYVGVDGSQ